MIEKKKNNSLIWSLLGYCLSHNDQIQESEEALIKAKHLDASFEDSVLCFFKIRLLKSYKENVKLISLISISIGFY